MTGDFHVFTFDASDSLKEHKKRRPHTKTKGGCLSCKVKKVKCDQSRPVCARCQRNGLPCSYSSSLARPPPGFRQTPPPLPPSLQLSVFPSCEPSCGTPPQALLHHYKLNWASIFVLPNLGIPTSFQTPLLHLAAGRPHLLSALMAVSAAHLRHHAPNPSPHRLAEHFQQSVALRSFNALISKPMSTIPQDEVGTLLVTAILFNLLTFALPADEDPTPYATGAAAPQTLKADPSKSWVFSTKTTRLDWLAVQLGLRELVTAALPYRPADPRGDNQGEDCGPSRRGNPLADAVAEACEAELSPIGLELESRVPDTWIELFGITRAPPSQEPYTQSSPTPLPKPIRRRASLISSSPEGSLDEQTRNRLFREPLFVLAEARHLPPTMANVFHYLQFLGKLEPDFRQLLYDREPLAMWAFGFWLGLICRLDYIWWVTRRARRDWRAIVIWLRCCGVTERPGREGVLWGRMVEELEGVVEWRDGEREGHDDGGESGIRDELGMMRGKRKGDVWGGREGKALEWVLVRSGELEGYDARCVAMGKRLQIASRGGIEVERTPGERLVRSHPAMGLKSNLALAL